MEVRALGMREVKRSIRFSSSTWKTTNSSADGGPNPDTTDGIGDAHQEFPLEHRKVKSGYKVEETEKSAY